MAALLEPWLESGNNRGRSPKDSRPQVPGIMCPHSLMGSALTFSAFLICSVSCGLAGRVRAKTAQSELLCGQECGRAGHQRAHKEVARERGEPIRNPNPNLNPNANPIRCSGWAGLDRTGPILTQLTAAAS